MNRLFLLFSILTLSTTLLAQDISSWQSHTLTVNDLQDDAFKDFFNPLLGQTQFVMVGEQHFIQEVGEVTKAMYQFFTNTCNDLPDYSAVFETITMPKCLIWGKHDEFLVLDRMKEKVLANLMCCCLAWHCCPLCDISNRKKYDHTRT